MKLDKTVLANAFGLTAAVLWVACTVIIWLLPDFSLIVTEWWIHGLDISAMGGWNITLTTFLLGGLTITGSAWIAGWVFGWSWEKASERKK